MRQVIGALVGSVGAIAYTRFLQPEDLGVFVLAGLVYSGLFLLIQAPIRDAVVYFQNQEETYSSAAFWLLLSFSTVAVLLVLMFAGYLGQFYESELAASLTRWIVVAFYFQALAVVPSSLLVKHFRFAVHESLLTVVDMISLIGWVSLAAWGFGPWSLVIPAIIGSIFWAITTWIAARFRPVWSPGREAYRGIIRYSRALFGSKVIIYLNLKLDNLAVGTLGDRALGWYSFGESQSAFVALPVIVPVAQVALPTMAAVQDRLKDVARIYLDMLRLAATLTLPMQIGAIILADLAIGLLFGEQWLGAVPIFRAYLTFRLLGMLLEVSDAATSAIGRPDVRFRVDLLQLPFFVAGIGFGLWVWGGIVGITWSLVIVRLLVGLVYFGATLRILKLSLNETLNYVQPSALAAVLMGVIIYGLRLTGLSRGWLEPLDMPTLADIVDLVSLISLGAISYFIILYMLDRAGLKAVTILGLKLLVPDSIRNRLQRLPFIRRILRRVQQ